MWVKNLRHDLYKLERYTLEFNEYLKVLNNNKTNFGVVYYSLISEYSETLKSILMLLESNYKNEEELQTSRINNMSGVLILLRKLIEIETVLNILLNNKDDLYVSYINQTEIDESHVASMFNESLNVFKSTTKPKSKYFWLNKHFKKTYRSVNDLLNLGNYNKESKLMLELWLYECNYMAHPNLYSDNELIENFNGMFINLLRYIFEVIQQTSHGVYSMIKHIETVDQTKTNYEISNIERKIPMFDIFNKDYFIKPYYDESVDYPFVNKDYNNYAYDIRADYSFINAILTIDYDGNPLSLAKRRTLGKLLDYYVEDLKDLVIGFYNKSNIIFYTKIRQVLESISYIDLVLGMNEDEIEVYQAYTDVQRYKRGNYHLNKFNELNNTNVNINKELINSDKKLTVEQAYNLNVKFMKDYFLNKFNETVNTKTIKRANSFAYDGVGVPSNWQLIKNMLLRNNIDHKFYNGLYSLSSLHCHVNYFTRSNKNLSEEKFYVEVMKKVMDVVKVNYDKLFTLLPDEMKEKLPSTNSAINKVLYNLYNYDIIKVPSPF